MKNQQNPRYNMQGYLIEFDKQAHLWTWSKWEYADNWDGKKRVVHRSGALEFMKIFPSVLPTQDTGINKTKINSLEQMDKELNKKGVDFVFLHQGDSRDEKEFTTVEQAERFYKLNSYPLWNLTGYWFSFDWTLRSWAMYDTFSGELQFTPASAAAKLSKPSQASNHLPGNHDFEIGSRQSYSVH